MKSKATAKSAARMKERLAKSERVRIKRVKALYDKQRYDFRNPTCRFCNTEGHDFLAMSSCPNYCRYCNTLGHSLQGCTVQLSDINKNANAQEDARQYEVRFSTR